MVGSAMAPLQAGAESKKRATNRAGYRRGGVVLVLRQRP